MLKRIRKAEGELSGSDSGSVGSTRCELGNRFTSQMYIYGRPMDCNVLPKGQRTSMGEVMKSTETGWRRIAHPV